jgi:hypothetical protein
MWVRRQRPVSVYRINNKSDKNLKIVKNIAVGPKNKAVSLKMPVQLSAAIMPTVALIPHYFIGKGGNYPAIRIARDREE